MKKLILLPIFLLLSQCNPFGELKECTLLYNSETGEGADAANADKYHRIHRTHLKGKRSIKHHIVVYTDGSNYYYVDPFIGGPANSDAEVYRRGCKLPIEQAGL